MKKLLIIDDQEVFRRQFSGALMVTEYAGGDSLSNEIEIYEAGDGKQGIKMFERLKPDFLVIDIHMPDMNGMDVLEKIREDYPQEFCSTKIFMITTETDPHLKSEGKSMGIESWILKPINVIKFFNLLQRDYL